MLFGAFTGSLTWYGSVLYRMPGCGISVADTWRQAADEAGMQTLAHFWEVHGAVTTSSLLFTIALLAFLVFSRYRHKARSIALKSLNEALEVAQQKAQESDRLKTSILQNMSHEIRTPLNAIMGYADLIASGDGEAQAMAERISASGSRLKQTLQTVMELAALEGGIVNLQTQAFNLNEVIGQTLEALEESAEEKSVAMSAEFKLESIEITSDPKAVRRALTPIVQNAIQYSKAGQVQIRVESCEERAIIIVEDTGIGMSPSFVSQACDPFKQESTGLGRKYEGTGLGLSISSQLIALLGGELDIASKPAEGCTVTVALPYSI